MLSVIELAQLLTGALDQKFNITNKAAAIQVVSCLEAFNLTQESFQEVQNTRIIKDLQALRQNKANDQALAKRIKNILRKWKERLAVAPSAHPSQPNSPQNFSQGSSDTQFMTQQSQSPPISQLPNHQRAVNGPISFTNLLPKPQQPPLNHLVHITKPMTSPAPPVPYQNGTASSQESLLGKRKLIDTPAVVGADVDENSNHSRNKKMKKFHSMAISSPLSLNPNNSSINHNNHLINPPIPTVPAQLPPEEAPKKRGRKKGSKGVDSMLNGLVPDFQTDIQQKIALSAGKRNKTTVELQQMLESHQNTAMSWTNGDVDSSSLDRGFNSSSFQPPDSTFASHGEDFQKKIKQEMNGESHFDAVPSTSAAANTRSLTIEEEIAELRAKLPPIDYEAAESETFDEYCPVDDYGEPVECTCTFREVITYAEPEEAAAPAAVNGFPALLKDDVKNGVSNVKPEDSDDDDETDDFCAVEDDDDDLGCVKLPAPVRGAVKSIFDPEYDANENLIEEMVRRKPRDIASKVIEVKIEKAAVKPMRIEPLLMPEPVPEVERVPIINYECDEDPMCPARAHFRRDPVTKLDVVRISRNFVQGVNGFWNGIPEEKPQHDYKKDMENIDYARHQLWKRVVPRYDFLTCDKIPKTFDDGSPFSVPPPPPLDDNDDDENEDSKPFNGAKNKSDKEFREWHELMNVRSYNDDVLTILPYVIID